jgi:benzoyl-CoA 2,3-dioxygenase component B
VFEGSGVDFEITVPHKAFNRRVGEFCEVHVDPEGNLLAAEAWQARRDQWLPTQADEDYLLSLMKPETEKGKYADWIAPPKQGIDKKPGDFEYVALN